MFEYSVCDFCPLPESSCDGCAHKDAERKFYEKLFGSSEEVTLDE